jgi:nucleotide-binding universal stress UspA family protein
VDGARTARTTAEAAGVPFRTLPGPVVENLVRAGEEEDVVAVVIGARGTPSAPRPLGATAAAVATALGKPVVIVPPDADPPSKFRRVLVPLEGTVSTSLAPAMIIELAPDAELEVLALHVYDLDSLPAFTDPLSPRTSTRRGRSSFFSATVRGGTATFGWRPAWAAPGSSSLW